MSDLRTGSNVGYDPTLAQIQSIGKGLVNALNAVNTTQIEGGEFAGVSGGLAGLSGLPGVSSMNNEDLIALMTTLKSKLENEQLKTSSEDVLIVKAQKKADAEQRINELEEAATKAKDAEKSGEIGKIFSWIAAAFMVLAGAILLATGAGAAAGVALLVGGATMMATMALQETGGMEKMLDGMAKGLVQLSKDLGVDPPLSMEDAQIISTAIVGAVVIAAAVVTSVFAGPAVGVAVAAQFLGTLFTPDNLQKMGVSEEDAPWVSMGISIGLALTSIGVGVGSTVAAMRGGADAATKIAGLSTKLAGNIAEKLGTSTEKLSKLGSMMSLVAQGMQAAAEITSGGMGIKAAIDTRDSAEAQAKAKELEASLLKLQQMLQDESERIDEIIKRLMEASGIVIDVFNQADATNSKINKI